MISGIVNIYDMQFHQQPSDRRTECHVQWHRVGGAHERTRSHSAVSRCRERWRCGIKTVTLPAPIRGIIETENWAYTKPGCANIIDNWFPTQKGLRLRGGTERWAVLPAPVEIVRSGFEYISGAQQSHVCRHRHAAVRRVVCRQSGAADRRRHHHQRQLQRLRRLPTAAATGCSPSTTLATMCAASTARSGNISTPAFVGTPTRITGVAPARHRSSIGHGLTYVWKYRNRLFFIQGGTMNAWCLPVDAVGGELIYIPLSGAAKRGGSLLFGASWSVDAATALTTSAVFVTDQGEVLVFTGTDPTSAANWRQEGRYDISKPLGKNGHQQLGGDVLIVTVDGIVPLSAAMQKDVSALSLAAITYNIEPMWMREFRTKDAYPWTIAKWDEGDACSSTFPAARPTDTQTVGVSNLHTGAWCTLHRLGCDVLHAAARQPVLRHARRQDHAGRKHRLRRRALG